MYSSQPTNNRTTWTTVLAHRCGAVWLQQTAELCCGRSLARSERGPGVRKCPNTGAGVLLCIFSDIQRVQSRTRHLPTCTALAPTKTAAAAKQRRKSDQVQHHGARTHLGRCAACSRAAPPCRRLQRERVRRSFGATTADKDGGLFGGPQHGGRGSSLRQAHDQGDAAKDGAPGAGADSQVRDPPGGVRRPAPLDPYERAPHRGGDGRGRRYRERARGQVHPRGRAPVRFGRGLDQGAGRRRHLRGDQGRGRSVPQVRGEGGQGAGRDQRGLRRLLQLPGLPRGLPVDRRVPREPPQRGAPRVGNAAAVREHEGLRAHDEPRGVGVPDPDPRVRGPRHHRPTAQDPHLQERSAPGEAGWQPLPDRGAARRDGLRPRCAVLRIQGGAAAGWQVPAAHGDLGGDVRQLHGLLDQQVQRARVHHPKVQAVPPRHGGRGGGVRAQQHRERGLEAAQAAHDQARPLGRQGIQLRGQPSQPGH